MTERARKIKCPERRCGWRGTEDLLLSAPNPFNRGEIISACPKCKTIDTNIYACAEPDCWADGVCGTPTLSGYKSTCGEHRPGTEEVG